MFRELTACRIIDDVAAVIVEADVECCGCLSDVDEVVPGALCGVNDVGLRARTSSNFVGSCLCGVVDELGGIHVALNAGSAGSVMSWGGRCG